jgi:hypothetical protein
VVAFHWLAYKGNCLGCHTQPDGRTTLQFCKAPNGTPASLRWRCDEAFLSIINSVCAQAAGTAPVSFTSTLLEPKKLTAEEEFDIKWSSASLYSGESPRLEDSYKVNHSLPQAVLTRYALTFPMPNLMPNSKLGWALTYRSPSDSLGRERIFPRDGTPPRGAGQGPARN